jgi:hypothetical protein
MKPEEIFMKKIAAELKTQTGFNLRDQVFFPLRYAKNRPVTVEHKTIAKDLMQNDPRLGPGDYVTSIGTTSQNVVKAMVNKYQAEMENHGVDIAILLNGQQGQRGTWQKVYNWLWQHKYPRWLAANSWELLRENATSPANWIRFLTEEMADLGRFRGPYLEDEDPEPEIPPIIPVDKKLWMAIDLQYSNCQFLLFNRSEAGVVLLCPSFGYAPNPVIDKPPLLLPQRDSFAEQKSQKFLFKDKGQEEFLGIVLNKPLNLPWLIPQQQERIPKWNTERIMDLFNHLEQSGEWQVFYQSFEVVESETKADQVDNG